MTDKPNLQMGQAEWRPSAQDAFNAIESQRLRADAWKAMAERLAKELKWSNERHGSHNACKQTDDLLIEFDALKRSDP